MKSVGIYVQVLEGGILPSKKNLSDAGFDLYATDDIVLCPRDVIKHPLNIRLHIPCGTWAEITTKSGLGSRGQLVYAGVIDEGYRGIPHVVMTNVGNDIITLDKGTKIAQMIMHPFHGGYYVRQVDGISTETDRGTGGFGSTGDK